MNLSRQDAWGGGISLHVWWTHSTSFLLSWLYSQGKLQYMVEKKRCFLGMFQCSKTMWRRKQVVSWIYCQMCLDKIMIPSLPLGSACPSQLGIQGHLLRGPKGDGRSQECISPVRQPSAINSSFECHHKDACGVPAWLLQRNPLFGYALIHILETNDVF